MASDAVKRKKRKRKSQECVCVFGTVQHPCPLKAVFTIFLLGATLISKNYLKRKKVLVERGRAPVKWWSKEIRMVVSD